MLDLSETLGEYDQSFIQVPFLFVLFSTLLNYFAYQYVIHELAGYSLFHLLFCFTKEETY